MLRKLIVLILVLSLTSCGNGPTVGPLKPHIAAQAALVHDWPNWGGDEGGVRFSPLDQIDRANVSRLVRAWTYHTGDVADGSNNTSFTTFECTPLVIDDTMYITTPYSRAIALDPETGTELWAFDPGIVKGAQAHWMMINRGVASWKGRGEHRILLATMDGDLWCLNSADGKPVGTFGEAGKVAHGYLGQGGRKLHGDEASPENLPTEWMGSVTSAPVIYKDIVIVGGQLPYLRAYNVTTGALVWERSKIPASDDPDRATWEGAGLAKQGGSFCWSPMSVDSERGLLFVGTDSPTPDFYGGERIGDDRPCNSILALEAFSGRTVWQFQTSHHDVWDYDLPAQPNLITVRRGGREVPAVAVSTKQGFLFVFHRETGEPLFEVLERPVPQSSVPGEKLSATQPFPTAPPPYARQRATPADIATVTPEHEALARENFKRWNIGGLYDAPNERGTVVFPNTIGGGAWGGGCFDPHTGLYYISASNVGSLMKMVPTGKESPKWERVTAEYNNGRFWDNPTRIPFTSPPWSTLTALDLDQGTLAWQVPLGNPESLTGRGITGLGTVSMGGAIVTAGGLVFIAASNDRTFHAFDSATGALLWEAAIDGSGHAVPMTFLGRRSGKQYVVIAAGGGNKFNDHFDDALVAFSLP